MVYFDRIFLEEIFLTADFIIMTGTFWRAQEEINICQSSCHSVLEPHHYITHPSHNVDLILACCRTADPLSNSPTSCIFLLKVSLISCVPFCIDQSLPLLSETLLSLAVLAKSLWWFGQNSYFSKGKFSSRAPMTETLNMARACILQAIRDNYMRNETVIEEMTWSWLLE